MLRGLAPQRTWLRGLNSNQHLWVMLPPSGVGLFPFLKTLVKRVRLAWSATSSPEEINARLAGPMIAERRLTLFGAQAFASACAASAEAPKAVAFFFSYIARLANDATTKATSNTFSPTRL